MFEPEPGQPEPHGGITAPVPECGVDATCRGQEVGAIGIGLGGLAGRLHGADRSTRTIKRWPVSWPRCYGTTWTHEVRAKTSSKVERDTVVRRGNSVLGTCPDGPDVAGFDEDGVILT